MPICSSGTQCPLYSAAPLGLHVIGPHANLPSHIILTPRQPVMFLGPYFITSTMQAETTAILNVFGMTGPSTHRELNPQNSWSVLGPLYRRLLQSAGATEDRGKLCFSNIFSGNRILLYCCLYHWVKKNITFQMMYNMLFYLKYSLSNQRKTKTALDDCCLSSSVRWNDSLKT